MQVASSPIRLSELNQLIQLTIDGVFREQQYSVIAETTGISQYPSKNQCYLTLIEKCDLTNTIKASIKARIWGASFPCIEYFEQTTGQAFKENIQVLLKVRVNYHVHYGLSLDIDEIDCNFTIGKLALTRQAVLQKLLHDNPEHITEVAGEYITYNKQLKLPPVIQHVALISSAQADGYIDFLHELYNNRHQFSFTVDEYLTRVQGADAHKEIYQQLVKIYESGIKYDAVVMVRGGGSQIDFQAFDTYLLSRAVARFPIPIITGIGHEKNESICDLMSCLKTKTPTKAANNIIAHNQSFLEKILNLEKQVVLKANEIMISQELVLNALQSSFISRSKDLLNKQQKNLKTQINAAIYSAAQRLQQEKRHLLKIKFNLQCHAENLLKTEDFKLQHLNNNVKYLDPKNILKRGYALVYKNGKAVSSVRDLTAESVINTHFFDGEVESQVLRKQINDDK